MTARLDTSGIWASEFIIENDSYPICANRSVISQAAYEKIELKGVIEFERDGRNEYELFKRQRFTSNKDKIKMYQAIKR